MRTLPVLLLAALVACGPKASAPVTPHLPGDGDAHVAKPTPVEPKKTPDDPWAKRTDLIQAPATQPPAKLELPPIEHFTLKNGLEVYVVQSDRLPVVSMQLAVKVGREDEPRAKLGVSDFVASMLVKGTKKKSALDIAKKIDFVGGQLGADASYEATLVTCSAMAKDLSTCMTLVPEVVTQPSFPKAELEKVRDQMLGEVRARLDDAGQLANAHLQNLLWGDDHVRGWITSEASVAAIQRDDLTAWHKTWFVPNNAILAVAGDVDVAKLKVSLEKAFGGWKKGKVPARATPTRPTLDRVKVRLVDMPKQTQTHIRIGEFGISHTDARFFDTLVWNYVLGGGQFSSRLMKVVRSAGGKTYGASSTFDRNLDEGSFVVATFTRTAETVDTVNLVLDEIAKMQKDGPDAEEVADAISNIAGSYAIRYESATDLASALIAAELHGFGEEYLSNYAVRVGMVDVDSARDAASAILDPTRFVIVLVGDAKTLEPQLQKAGWAYEKVRFTDPVTAPLPAPTHAVTPAEEKAARKVLDAALAAKGKKAGAIASLRLHASGTLTAQGTPLDVEITRVFLSPDKMRVDLDVDVPQMGVQKIAYALDGKDGWQSTPDGQVDDIPAGDIGVLEEQRWHDPEFILTRYKEKGTKIEPLPDDTVDGKACAVIHLISADGAAEATLYIDKKTSMVLQMAYPESGRVTVDRFDDYKDVGGVLIAHHRVSESGQEHAELTIDEAEVDGKVDADTFHKPAK